MQKLNLPEYTFRIRKNSGKSEIFDIARKKFVRLSPEEWVRQNFILFLVNEKNYPLSLISVEKSLKYYKLSKKADILIYDNCAKPRILIECKAPSVSLNQDVFNQLAVYNMAFKVDFLIITNGIEHYCCKMNYSNNTFQFLPDIPGYSSICP